MAFVSSSYAPLRIMFSSKSSLRITMGFPKEPRPAFCTMFYTMADSVRSGDRDAARHNEHPTPSRDPAVYLLKESAVPSPRDGYHPPIATFPETRSTDNPARSRRLTQRAPTTHDNGQDQKEPKVVVSQPHGILASPLKSQANPARSLGAAVTRMYVPAAFQSTTRRWRLPWVTITAKHIPHGLRISDGLHRA